MNTLRLVVFDMDGTLIDSQDVIVEAMGRAFARIDRPAPSAEQTRAIIGLSLDKAVSTIAPDLTPTQVTAGVAAYRQSFIEMREESGAEAAAPMYPGAMAALERLHSQDETLLGVATGKARRGLDHAYASHGIGHFFVTHQTADGHPSKPHPSMLHQALHDTGVEAKHAVMIGDTEFDIAMGKAAGFATIGVSWGYHSLDRIKAATPDFIIDGYNELDATLENIWQARS
ncbi:MAG: HAD family hydrolase [Rhodobacteraceae bacterium]|nr:MAG: HAD family hydrolase [Paracoccaceae bacterium]